MEFLGDSRSKRIGTNGDEEEDDSPINDLFIFINKSSNLSSSKVMITL